MRYREPYTEYAEWPGWRGRLNRIIFGTDSSAGRAFDVALMIVIGLSVLVVMLESVSGIRVEYGPLLIALEWIFTIIFTIEYVLRLACAAKPLRYARSFFGIVDLAATLPTYLAIILPGAQLFRVIRLLRILRVFRVLKLIQYISEARLLVSALRSARRKIAIFIYAVATLVVLLGSLMYLIEGEQNGFTSIPKSVYWAIVTLTTVGYGDISPQTGLGQALASVVMLLGYAIIAVPTGIVTAEIVSVGKAKEANCENCGKGDHAHDAKYCKHCGAAL